MNKNKSYFWILILIPLGFVVWYFFSSANQKPIRLLPYFGPRGASSDTVHIVPYFTFTDQDGKALTSHDLDGKIYVTEFFFTTCQSICPIMNSYLEDTYEKFRNEKDLHFLSHTVDPETDSVPVLKAYADKHNVNDQRWHFVTGKTIDIYRMARKGYLLDDGAATEDEFVHTQKFVLVDKEKRIRGYYDGTDSLEMVRMDQDINLLVKEYAHRKK